VAVIIGVLVLAGCSALLDLSPLDFRDESAEGGRDSAPNGDAPSDALVSTADSAIDAGPDAQRPWRYVFVTSEQRDGTLAPDGGLSGRAIGDAWCKSLADQGLPAVRGLTWVAWLSLAAGPSNAFRRITTGGEVALEYRLVNDTVVLPAKFAFDGASPSSPIQLDESGNNPAPRIVWTGTDKLGIVTSNTCSDWTSRARAPSGTIGTSTDQQGWTVNPTVTQTCDELGHVYCFETP
jgi:hypothetical protein